MLADGSFADELHTRGLQGGDELHQRIHIAANHALARLHSLNGGQRQSAGRGQCALVHAIFATEGGTIAITGTLTQHGQFGQVTGTYSQSNGEVGNATLSELNGQFIAITGRLSLISTDRGCRSVVYFGGSRVR